MLGGMGMKRRWEAKGKTTGRPNLITGPVQVCWHKFTRYWDVEHREKSINSSGHKFGLAPLGVGGSSGGSKTICRMTSLFAFVPRSSPGFPVEALVFTLLGAAGFFGGSVLMLPETAREQENPYRPK